MVTKETQCEGRTSVESLNTVPLFNTKKKESYNPVIGEDNEKGQNLWI